MTNIDAMIYGLGGVSGVVLVVGAFWLFRRLGRVIARRVLREDHTGEAEL